MSRETRREFKRLACRVSSDLVNDYMKEFDPNDNVDVGDPNMFLHCLQEVRDELARRGWDGGRFRKPKGWGL